MYVSDYYYAASPTYWSYVSYNSSDATLDYRAAIDSNWLYLAGYYEWTLVRTSSNSNAAFLASAPGNIGNNAVNNAADAVRPTFFLDNNVKFIQGNGTMSSPIIIM